MSVYFIFGCGVTLASVFGVRKLIARKKKQPKFPSNTILLIDESIDHKFNIFDLARPIVDAFDKPQEVCDRIKSTPDSDEIHLIMTTIGGPAFACEKILKCLQSHPAGYIAYIRNECLSSGTFLALAAKEIVMTDSSYLGKIDPQIQTGNATTWPAIVYHGLPEKVKNKHAPQCAIAEMALNYTEKILKEFAKDNIGKIRSEMIYSRLPHEKTFDFDECLAIGLQVRKPREDEMQYFF